MLCVSRPVTGTSINECLFHRSESPGSLRRLVRPCPGRAVKQQFTWCHPWSPERKSRGAMAATAAAKPRRLEVQAGFRLIIPPTEVQQSVPFTF
ncbi:hypothetical protein AAFF_G00430390 [Aldrovandia affinis]|uniref:Uncharacterized protein n=1 Tax=Aldrovandia affinis TaxID=143900 RepID=A0AAD7S923_9TELE|nr:hypothetical protein AAFF_G00430390 [Aldrovandia affinis]